MSERNQSEYIYSGTLYFDSPTYTIRKADAELYSGLKAGNFCYVFNSRQTGKSSLRVRTMRLLQNEGIACAEVDLSAEGANDVTQEQWYAGIIYTLIEKFNLDFDLESWWNEQDLIAYVKRFSKFIDTVLLVQLRKNNPEQKIIIFVDEIDSVLSLNFSTDDFFTLIRAYYNQRADNPIYNHITFCLLGATTPSNLITDKQRTPFNIGQAIELTGFTLEEAKPSLMPGLVGIRNPEAVLQFVLNWTGGQPFLTQKVCNFLVKSNTEPRENEEAQWVEEIVQSRIIANWESQDEPEHLRTILNRIICDKNEKYRSRLLGLYQRILLSASVMVDESQEQVELRLSGLVVKTNATLKVYNRIYKSVFDWNWVEKELGKLRPYADGLTAWFDSNSQDESRLLRGKALRDAQAWAMGKNLSDRDYQFLAASELLSKREAEIAYQQEKKARELEKLEYEVKLETERKGAEAQKQANEILTKATKKANGRIRVGSIILVSSLLLSLFGVMQVELSRQYAVTATRLEQDGINLSRQIDQQSNIDDLVLAVKTGRKLKSLVEQKQSLVDYPAYSPVFNLQTILLGIREKNRLEVHKNRVKSVVYSPDGKTLASASRDHTIKLWDGATGKKISTLTGHFDWVMSVVFSPDGKTLASASRDKSIKLWNVATGKEISTLNGYKGGVNSVVYSPDGKTLATASDDKTVKLWNVSNSKLIYNLNKHKDAVRSVVYSPDGKRLATASRDKTIKLWDVATGTEISTLSEHEDGVNSVVYSPDGKTLATASDDNGINDNSIKLWDVAREKQIATLTGHTFGINSVVYSPDGKTLATASSDTTIKLWNVATKKEIYTLAGHQGSVNSVVYSPNGKTLATASDDETIKLWNVAYSKQISTLTGHKNSVFSANYSPDGKTLASASRDNTIKLWDMETRKEISTLKGHKDWVMSAVYSPDSKTLATTSRDQTIKLWDMATRKEISTLKGHKALVFNADYSPDGKTLATASADNTIKLWDVATRKEISTLTGHSDWVNSVVYSPDGKTLATASADKTIKLWDVARRKEISTLKGHKSLVFRVVYSPDGKTLATASADTNIKLWDVATRKETSTLTGHKSWVIRVAYSPDGKTLATASSDKTIKLWDVATGRQIYTLTGHKSEVFSVVYSSDGKTLATASADNTIKLWNLDLDSLLVQGCDWLEDYLASRPDEAKNLCPKQ